MDNGMLNLKRVELILEGKSNHSKPGFSRGIGVGKGEATVFQRRHALTLKKKKRRVERIEKAELQKRGLHKSKRKLHLTGAQAFRQQHKVKIWSALVLISAFRLDL